jgi:DNA-binding FrmR family transcriptional regulator
VEISETEKRRLVARLHRIAGQIRGLENRLNSREHPLLLLNQFEAVISAAKSVMQSYVGEVIDQLPTEDRSQLIRRLIRKS